MNTEKRLNQLLRQADVNISEEVDQQILEQSKQNLVLDKSSTPRKRWFSFLLWAAALIGILLGLEAGRISVWMKGSEAPSDIQNPTIPPTRVLSIQSMRQAYLQGDLDRLEDHLDRATMLIGPRPTAMLEKMNSSKENQS